MNWIYSIAFRIANIGQVSAAEEAVDRLDRGVEGVNNSLKRAGDSADRFGSKSQNAFNSSLRSLKSWVAGLGMGLVTLNSINAAANFDAQNIAIDFATGGQGAETIEYLEQTSDRLGISLSASREGFKQLAAGLRGTALEGEATRGIFEGVATAGAAMRLSADDIGGAYRALSQIASKGKVQAEELRGQLGERLPGAFRIAARAMGVTQSELNKLLETGQVTAEDFLPKFAAALQEEFGPLAAEVANGPAAAMERFRNQVGLLQVAFGNELLPMLTDFLQKYGEPAIAFMKEHISQFITIGGVILGVVAISKVYALAVGGVNLVTGLAAAAQWKWNAAMSANPIAAVITLLAALAVGVAYAWNQFAGFRAFLYGFREVVKEIGRIMWDNMISPLMSMGKIIAGIFTFDKAMIVEGLTEAGNLFTRESESIGERIGTAFRRGQAAGYNAFAAAKEADAVTRHTSAETAAGAGGGGTTDGDTTTTTNTNNSTTGLTGITGRNSTKNITINLDNLVGDLRIAAATVDEGADEMADIVMRKLLQVLNTANQVQ